MWKLHYFTRCRVKDYVFKVLKFRDFSSFKTLLHKTPRNAYIIIITLNVQMNYQ